MRAVMLVLALVLAPSCASKARPDGGELDDRGADASQDAGGDLDAEVEDRGSADGDTVVNAIAGEHCAPEELAGLVQVEDMGGAVFVAASWNDKPAPWIGPAALTDSSCVFHEFSGNCTCDVDEVCAFDGTCTAPPVPAQDLRLVLGAEGQEQVFSGSGGIGGEITLPGRTFSVELRGFGRAVKLSQTTVPEMLTSVNGVLDGTYDAPLAVDVTWDAPAGGSEVFTHIPINHHVGSPTFTECVVDAAGGALHVDGAMLQPLSVATGLEFQGILHVRFAAADTSNGCVEFRFFTLHYVSLF